MQTFICVSPNFIFPLRLRDYQPVFGIVDLQYINFEKGWPIWLQQLLKSLEKQNVPRLREPVIQPEWAAYHRRRSINLLNEPEILTSNWLRILSVPDQINYVVPTGAINRTALKASADTFDHPLVPMAKVLSRSRHPLILTLISQSVTAFACPNGIRSGCARIVLQPDVRRVRRAWVEILSVHTRVEFSTASAAHCAGVEGDL
ncbi:MAG: hypothetical protein OXF74_09080 [Rhodobacteraceae bacterium]|nr:hypothetical protein [Paracoccaceae bacterium]